MWGENYPWHFDYVRLASDAGFYFERHKTQNFDKAKTCNVDVERVIADRDVATVEHYIPTVINFVLDPDQTELLDASFVKKFRITQLSVEYLLFCKKYLDNTVVQLKDELQKYKKENEELKTFVEELKTHIAALMAKIQEQVLAAYKCNECSKVFSTEEFLSSHKKRRHYSNAHLDCETSARETDKLHMEIKELKGRLNNAEKMMQENTSGHTSNRESVSGKEYDLKFLELHQKFDILKTQVEMEIRSLQNNQNLEDKCGRWFGRALQSARMQEKDGSEKNEKVEKRRKDGQTTQTGTTTTEGTAEDSESAEGEKKEQSLHAQKQISQFGEALESKVTTSIQKIEDQMQSFWNKLREMEASSAKAEKNRFKSVINEVFLDNLELSETSDDHKGLHPAIKPRSKYTLMQTETEFEKISENIEVGDTDESEKQNKDCKNDRSERNDKDKSERNNKKDRSERNDKKDRSGRNDIKNSSERNDRKDRSERNDKNDRSEKIDEDDTSNDENRRSSPKPVDESEVDSEVDSRTDIRMSPTVQQEASPRKTFTKPPSPMPRKSKMVATQHQQSEIVPETKHPEKSSKKRKKKQRKIVDEKQSEQQQSPKIKTVSSIKKNRRREHEEESSTDSGSASEVRNSPDKERDDINSPTLMEDFEKEVERVLNKRLQSIGVSPEWKGLPDRSYERAMAIVNHQAHLMKKTVPNFDTVATEIKKEVAKKVSRHVPSKKLDQPRKIKSSPKKKKVEIKYRSMYATDSESEDANKAYDKVVDELRLVTRARDVNTKKPSKKPKKKVLFDLTDRNVEERAKDGGSTTSMASSVLDGTPRHPRNRKDSHQKNFKESPNKKAVKEKQQQPKHKVEVAHRKDIEDLSDYDFSEM